MAGEYSGRIEKIGLGIEATPGTAVAPQVGLRHLSSKFQPQTTTIKNDSAMGRVERFNESALDTKWAEGPIEFKVGDISVGYPLTGIFGLPVTTDNADANAAVKDHTFDVIQSNTPTYLTVAVDNPTADRRHALGVVDTLSISGARGKFVQAKMEMKAKSGSSASNTIAYASPEYEFTLKHVSLKVASSVAGLSGATALEIKSFELNIERKTAPFFPAGSSDPTAFNSGDFEASGEFVVRYNATTHEDNFLSNLAQAMRLSITNTDATIGTAANPGLVFTAPQTRLTTFDRSDDLGEIVDATVGFTCELSASDGYLIRAVLTNTQAAYAAA